MPEQQAVIAAHLSSSINSLVEQSGNIPANAEKRDQALLQLAFHTGQRIAFTQLLQYDALRLKAAEQAAFEQQGVQ